MHNRNFSQVAGRGCRGLTAAVLAATLVLGTGLAGDGGAAWAQTTPRATDMTTGMLPADFTEVIERVSPAVVNIQVTQRMETGNQVPQGMPKGMEEFFKRFFGEDWAEQFGFRFKGPEGTPRRGPPVQGLGSGFLIDPDGYIVTNNHVVAEAGKITVTLQDRREFQAKLVGTDPETDLALLKIEADRPLPFVKFSTDPTPRPGRWVIAVGNPFGLDHTATAGIVSATGRSIGAGPYDDFIQIDAPINRGNSGGPTFNLKGEVVGVNTAIYSPSGGSVGIGFAIPASIARDVVDQLRKQGRVERGWLGVEIQAVTPEIAESLGLDRPQGALIARVIPDGPARDSGLRQGDLVLSINGKQIDQVRDLSRHVAELKPGSTAKLEVLRNERRHTVSVRLGSRPAPDQLAARQPGDNDGSSNGGRAALGMELATVDDRARQAFGIPPSVRGAVITGVEPDSEAAAKGLEVGDVILSVGGSRVTSAADAAQKIEAARKSGKKAVLMLVRKGEGERFVALPIG